MAHAEMSQQSPNPMNEDVFEEFPACRQCIGPDCLPVFFRQSPHPVSLDICRPHTEELQMPYATFLARSQLTIMPSLLDDAIEVYLSFGRLG